MPRIIEFLGYTPYILPQTLGDWLRQCRVSHGLSQEALARTIAVDESTIAAWERNDHQPVKSSLQVLRDFFGSIHPE